MKIKLSDNAIVATHSSYKIGENIKCKQIMCEHVYDGHWFSGCKDCNIDKIQMRNNNFKICSYEDIKDLIVEGE